MLSCYILFHHPATLHHHATLNQAGWDTQEPGCRVHWSDYRLGIRVLGRLARSLKSAGTSQNRMGLLKMLPIPTLRYHALCLPPCPYPF